MKFILALVAATASSAALIGSAVPANAQSLMPRWDTYVSPSSEWIESNDIDIFFDNDSSRSERGWGHSSGDYFGG